jgi:hypothetical protein
VDILDGFNGKNAPLLYKCRPSSKSMWRGNASKVKASGPVTVFRYAFYLIPIVLGSCSGVPADPIAPGKVDAGTSDPPETGRIDVTNGDAAVSGESSAGGDPDVTVDSPDLDSTGPCGPATCGGCCDTTGNCLGGAADMTCGNNGQACVNCMPAGQTCAAGVCAPFPSGSSGGSSSSSGGACVASSCPKCTFGAACCRLLGGCGCLSLLTCL